MTFLLPEFPTDRWEDSPDLGVGLDTITVVGPATDELLDLLHYQQIDRIIDLGTGELTDRRLGSRATFSIGLAKVRVTGKRRGGHLVVSIEVSLPKMLNGHNRNPLHLDMLHDAVDVVLHVLGEDLPGVPRMRDVGLQRLDIARDFHGVGSPTMTLEALSQRHFPHARFHHLHLRPDGHLQTVSRGSPTQFLTRGYAKGYELAEQARRASDTRERLLLNEWAACSQEQVRFEVQLRRPVLKRRGIHTMTDCTPENLRAIARIYFKAAGWDSPFGGDQRMRDALADLLPGLSAADGRNLMVFLFAEMHGLDVPLTRHAIETVRPIARRNHLLDPANSAPARRLDFDTGRELLD